MQKEFIGPHSIEKIKDILDEIGPKKIFLVTGKNSYTPCGAKKVLDFVLKNYSVIHFDDFSENLKIQDVVKAVNQIEDVDLVIAVGGGSAMDLAKSANILKAQDGDPESYITGKNKPQKKGKPLLAIPTTTGSGSEATAFSVIYDGFKKCSLAYDAMLPTHVILDPVLSLSMPKEVAAASSLDAFSQAIESFWSICSTEESRGYSKQALALILDNIVDAVNNPNLENRTAMILGANFAGKAINIAKTTVCHAMAYPMSVHYGVKHGHAVALTLGKALVYNAQISEENCNDLRGARHVKQIMAQLLHLLGCNNWDEAEALIIKTIESVGLESSTAVVCKDFNYKDRIMSEVNLERLGNNPIKFLHPLDLKGWL